MNIHLMTLFLAVWLLAPLPAAGQTETATRYQVLSTNRLGTLRSEIDRAAREGYRVIASARPAALVLLVVLERADVPHEYVVSDRLSREVRDGRIPSDSHLLPHTVGGAPLEACGGIFERVREGGHRRDYRVENASNPRNLQKDILTAAMDGYRLAAIGAASDYCAVLERGPRPPVPAAAPMSGAGTATSSDGGSLTAIDYAHPYVLISDRNPAAIATQIAAAAAAGFRLHSGVAGGQFVFVMERPATDMPPADYHLLATDGGSATIERELNGAAARGYRVLRSGVATAVGAVLGVMVTHDTVALMERQPDSRFEYRVISTARVGTFEREVRAAGEEDWEFVALARAGTLMAIMERPVSQPQPTGEPH